MQQPQFDRSMEDMDALKAKLDRSLKQCQKMGARAKAPDETHFDLPPQASVADNGRSKKRDTAWQKIRKLFG